MIGFLFAFFEFSFPLNLSNPLPKSRQQLARPPELVVSYGPARYDTFLRLPLPSYFARNREEEKNKLQTAEEVGGKEEEEREVLLRKYPV